MDKTIPIIASKNLFETAAEYEKLGFEVLKHHIGNGYLIANMGEIEIHFFLFEELDRTQNYCGLYIRTENVDDIHALWSKAALPKTGQPRLEPVQNKPWGMREFAMVDNNGNLIRVGKVI